MTISIRSLDHLVITARDLRATIDFYTNVLGMKHVAFGNNLHAFILATRNSTFMMPRPTCRRRPETSRPDPRIFVSYLRHRSHR